MWQYLNTLVIEQNKLDYSYTKKVEKFHLHQKQRIYWA